MARAFAIRISLSYALMMLGVGAQLPFLPLWLEAKGLDVAGIAMVVGGMMAVRVIGAPLFAWVADHFGNRKRVIQICAALAFFLYLALALSEGYGLILGVALVAAFLFSPVFPLTEGFSIDGSAAHGLDYGRLRLWASLSFLSGSLIAGALLTRIDPVNAIWLIAAAQGLSFASTLFLPAEPPHRRPEAATGTELSRARQLFFGSSFPLLMIAAGLGQASHGMLYSLSSVHWTSLGVSTLGIGFLWTAAVLSEVLLLAYSNRIVARFGPTKLLLTGLLAGVLRWVLLAFLTDYWLILAAQTLHAFTFATTHLGTMHFIRLLVPPHIRNRAQGINAAVSGGVLLSSTSWLSGWLYGSLGSHTYLAMAGVSLVAIGLAMLLLKISPRVRVAGAA